MIFDYEVTCTFSDLWSIIILEEQNRVNQHHAAAKTKTCVEWGNRICGFYIIYSLISKPWWSICLLIIIVVDSFRAGNNIF